MNASGKSAAAFLRKGEIAQLAQGRQPELGVRLTAVLRGPKDLVTCTAADGADLHCAPQTVQQPNEVVFDWLDATLG